MLEPREEDGTEPTPVATVRTYEFEATCRFDLVGAPVIELVPRSGGIARVVPHSMAVQIQAWSQDGQTGESRRWSIAVRSTDVDRSHDDWILREHDFQITPAPTWLLKIVEQVRLDVTAHGSTNDSRTRTAMNIRESLHD